ncbi:MAG: Zn-ribbon domain-containing OB-fold protein [Candidatus Thermoplasmatota archaeon]
MTVPRFWREISSRYNLIGTKCQCCDKIYFPPRSLCLNCHRKSIGKMEKVKLKETGEIVSYTVIHETSKEFEMQVPYIIGIIQMDDGPKLTSQIIEIKPEEVKIGMKVRATIRKLSEDGKSGIIHYGYKFLPV